MKKETALLTVVFVIAHPDDEHIPFGLPAQLAENGNLVHLVSLTKGDLGSHSLRSRREIAKVRSKEFALSAHTLGAQAKILGLRDGFLDKDVQKARMRLLATLREVQPDVVVLPNRNDYHQDHTSAFAIGQWATFHLPDSPIRTRRGFLGKQIAPYTHPVSVYEMDTQGSQTWSSTKEDTGEKSDHLSPVNTIIPLGEEAIAKSIEAFYAHESQLSPRQDGQIDYVRLAELSAMRRGKQIGHRYGAGLTFISFGGYAFSTENKLREAKRGKLRRSPL